MFPFASAVTLSVWFHVLPIVSFVKILTASPGCPTPPRRRRKARRSPAGTSTSAVLSSGFCSAGASRRPPWSRGPSLAQPAGPPRWLSQARPAYLSADSWCLPFLDLVAAVVKRLAASCGAVDATDLAEGPVAEGGRSCSGSG